MILLLVPSLEMLTAAHWGKIVKLTIKTDELQWLEHYWNHENRFEAGEVRANEC